jgi:hypothetical protein
LQISKITLPLALSSDLWLRVLEQFLLLMLIVGTFLPFVLLGVHVFKSNTTGIVRLTSIILQKKILKNPVFKSTIPRSLHPDF